MLKKIKVVGATPETSRLEKSSKTLSAPPKGVAQAISEK